MPHGCLSLASTPAIGRQGPEAIHLPLAEDLGEHADAVPPGCLDHSAGCFCPMMLFVPGGSS